MEVAFMEARVGDLARGRGPGDSKRRERLARMQRELSSQ
jgi:hypothetical protein